MTHARLRLRIEYWDHNVFDVRGDGKFLLCNYSTRCDDYIFSHRQAQLADIIAVKLSEDHLLSPGSDPLYHFVKNRYGSTFDWDALIDFAGLNRARVTFDHGHPDMMPLNAKAILAIALEIPFTS